MKRSLLLLSVVALVLGVLPAAALGGPKPRYFVDESKLPFEALPGAEALWGVHAGAGYRIEVPEDWNGKLVMWAHGFAGTGLELEVDDHPLRQLLIPSGYAWAASSYTANDYDVSAGVASTHQLVNFFKGAVGVPDQVLITGASMGGHITAASIEQFPATYDGALPICGVLGDVELFDYFLDFNVAAQQLGLGASTFPVDPASYLFGDVPQIKANLEAFPGGWPNVLNTEGEQLKQLTENRSGGDRPNFDEAWFFWNTFADFQSGPGNFLFDLGSTDGTIVGRPGVNVDNIGVEYHLDTDLSSLSADEVAFNSDVVRVEAARSARSSKGLSNVPIVTGDISVPVLTLHNLGDLFVPFFNEIVYAEEVAAQGNSDLLVQRAIRGVGHCDFTPAELGGAFLELAAWVDHGVKPAGDVILDPSAVSAADYGCRFTNGDHLLGTPCP